MTNLITRLESADGSSGSLLLEAAKAAWVWDYVPPGVDHDMWVKRWNRFHRMLDAEAWTSAAEMLVPEGWSCVLRPGFAEMRHPRNPQKDTDGHAKTTALALAAAALKARGV